MKEKRNISGVNQEFVLTLSQSDNKSPYCCRQHPITVDVDLIDKLHELSENNQATLLEMQETFIESFPRKEKSCYNHLIDWYNASYVNIVCYPKLMSEEEIRRGVQKMREEVKKQFKDTHRYLFESDSVKYEKEKSEYLEKMTNRYIYGIKSSFFDDCEKFIMADAYTKTLNKIKALPEIKVYSTATKGWSDFEFKINDSLDVHVKTNFGYGGSSYFFTNIKYKGIDILPYSHIVRYYYACMADIIRYTRKWMPVREVWTHAANFLKDIINDALFHPESFEQKWIFSEVETMINGLESIVNDPQKMMDSYADCKGITPHLVYVREFSGREQKKYEVYKSDMLACVQAEKVCGSLLLIDKLKSLESLTESVPVWVDRIKSVNKALYPELVSACSKIENEINTLKGKITPLEERIENLELAKQRIEEACGINPEMSMSECYEIRKMLINENSEYQKVRGLIGDSRDELKGFKQQQKYKENYFEIISQGVARIKQYVLAA